MNLENTNNRDKPTESATESKKEERKRKHVDFELVCHLCSLFRCKESDDLAKHVEFVHGAKERNLTKDAKKGVTDKRIKQEFLGDI